MLRPFAALFALALALSAIAGRSAPETPETAASAHPLAGEIVAVADGARLGGPAALADALRDADVVLIGETHDNAEHHAAQAWLTETLAPAGLAFEMIPPRMEDALAGLRAEGAPAALLEHALQWESRGWPDFGMYAPIFAAAPEATVTGAEIGMETLTRAMRGDVAGAADDALGGAAPLYRLGDPVAPEIAEAMAREMVAAHCDAIPMEVAQGMIGAQRLRDAALADAALRARAYGDGGQVVIITGNGHARRDRGAPAYLAAARPALSVVSVGLIEVREGAEDWRAYAEEEGAGPLFDYLWFTARAEREDPCERFLREHGSPEAGERG